MPTIKDSSSIEEVLQYIVACYGVAIYQEKQRLSNLIADLYTGEERLKRLYRRMVMEDAVSQQLYAIYLKPIQEREGFYNRLVFQFKETNFYEEAFARQVLDVFLHGMNLLLVEPISTKATEEDGEWYDEYGVKYSADRKKLIRAQEKLSGDYRVLDGTVVICDEAFEWCENLQEIALPSSITSIGDDAFLYCENLQEINVAKSNKVYRTIDSVLYTKDLKTIICYPAGKKNENFVILSGVMDIGNNSFLLCKNLREITMPSSITSIGDDAFLYCENLQEITLPPGVTSIGDQAFGFCENLQEINVTESNEFYRTIDGVLYTKDLKAIICYPAGKKNENFVIPSGVTSIEDYTFRDCKSLCEITIPSSVTSIGNNAFSSCSNLQEINVTESNKFYRAIDSVLYTKDLKTIICYPQGKKDVKFVTPLGVTSIGDFAFSHCSNLREITMPPGVTSIGDDAFNSCRNLQKITLPSGMTSIGDGAFSHCSNLREITLPPGVTSIGDGAFGGCNNLREITLPSSVTSIGDYAFNSCRNLQEVILLSNLTGNLISEGFWVCDLQQINIPHGTLEKFKKLLPNEAHLLHEI